MNAAKQPPVPHRRRRVLPALLGLLALPLALLVAHGLAWWWMTGAIAAGFADWTALRRAEGWRVEHDPPARGGWPFAAELHVPALRMETQGAGLAEPASYEAARIALRVAPPQFRRLVVAAQGPQLLRLGALDLPFVAARLEAFVPLDAGPAPRGMALLADGILAATPAGEAELRHARLSIAPGFAGQEPALLLDLLAEGLRLPPGAAGPAFAALGSEVEAAALAGALTGPPPMPPSARRARAWRDAGGALDLQRVALRWGPLGGEGRMRLVLDQSLQPAGAGTLRVAGAPAVLGAMEGAGLLAPSAARAAQGAVAMLSRVPPEGGPPEVELPVGIMQGRVSLARIPLLQLPPLAWP